MSRLSIEISDQQHKKIKALASWHGMSLKNYILEKTISSTSPDSDDAAALKELMEFLAPRIEAAKQGDLSKQSIASLIAKAKAQRRS